MPFLINLSTLIKSPSFPPPLGDSQGEDHTEVVPSRLSSLNGVSIPNSIRVTTRLVALSPNCSKSLVASTSSPSKSSDSTDTHISSDFDVTGWSKVNNKKGKRQFLPLKFLNFLFFVVGCLVFIVYHYDAQLSLLECERSYG